MNLIPHPLVTHAARIPDHPAVIDQGGALSYAELEARVRVAGEALLARGATTGSRVGIAAANCVEWIILTHALSRLGAVLVAFDPRWGAAEIMAADRVSQPLIVLAEADCHARISQIHDVAPRLVALSEISNLAQATTAGSLPAEIDPDRAHTIIFTSGTTGTPRGVALSYRNHLASALASAINLGIDPADSWLINLPLCHIGGLSIVLRAAIYGTTCVLHPRFDAEATCESLARDRVTQLSLVGTTLRRMLETLGDRKVPEWVRAILVGGGPVDVELLRAARAKGLPVLPTYGMTETASQVATLPSWASADKLDTVGPPLPFCEIEIRDDEGCPVAPEHHGQIHVRGPMVAMGYCREDGGIEPLTRDGWLAAHDCGCLDPDGHLIIQGRADTAIISGGEKIFPEEVEIALERLPEIRRAAVFGVNDPEWGRIVVALVETVPGATGLPADTRERLVGHLAAYKIPRAIATVPHLPLTRAGKIDRTKLHDIWAEATRRNDAGPPTPAR